ncbi:MAG: SEC-C domain-containing protein [Candidatus Abyssobacteria bacterium SURF_17]|jgi:hypothetical protein|uniref:SEC-C domain-containing protein n=1 Tax=Candidatus Abyssobacteria bacterium SURF_17 TaxID=2093361 RepID=A0A419F8G3_9BACT|nr:MAG: SEC-C domain-containing protein [Candidatus Abyssubacteria bacterium SURF_17]
MTTVGRNDPCPCGSGKKYKKCCMPKETAIDLQAYRANRAEESLRGEILRFATGDRFKDEMVEAFRKYHRDKVDTSLLLNQDPHLNIRFLDWFIHEHVHSSENKHIIELFDDLRGKHLDEDQRKLLDEWKASRLGAFEVESTDDGILTLKDVFGEGSYSFEDKAACDELKPGEIVVARLTSCWGKRQLAGAPIKLDADSKQKFIDSLSAEFETHQKDHPEAGRSKFLSENTHLLIAAASELSS